MLLFLLHQSHIFILSWKSSPFGLRCNNIHDPRIASDIPSWLPHSDIPVSSLQTDLMVDKSYHHHLAALNQHNPLVQNLMWNFRPSQKKPMLEGESNHADVEWRDTYSLVCNMANLYSGKKITTTPGPSTGRIMKVNEIEKLGIALHMSYDAKPIHMDYVYKPKHIVYGELCMVVSLLCNDFPYHDIYADFPCIVSFSCKRSTIYFYVQVKSILIRMMERIQSFEKSL